jgi:hypothetical protein
MIGFTARERTSRRRIECGYSQGRRCRAGSMTSA